MIRPIRIAIGLIRRGNYYLIRRRPELPGSPMPGLWEFPGGKCEPGESPEAAAARECAEETGMETRIGRLRRITPHTYPHGSVVLHYYDAEPARADLEPAADSGFRWVKIKELAGLEFPEANGPLIDELVADGCSISRVPAGSD